MGTTARTLIEDVSRYLSDNDDEESYIHWTEEDLLSYFRRAVSVVAVFKKDRFTRKIMVPMEEGAVQHIPDSCVSDVAVHGIAVDGVVKQRARKAALSTFPPLGRKRCSICTHSTEYQLASYEVGAPDARSVIIDPPAPAGVKGELVISCFAPQELVDNPDAVLDIGDDLNAAIFELMLYYAWGVDIEDIANRERSNQHWSNAMTLLGLDALAQTRARRAR